MFVKENPDKRKLHKSGINTKKDRCGVAFHFTNKCRDQENRHAFLKIQPIEQVSVKEHSEFDPLAQTKILASLTSNSHGMNNMADLYSKKRKGHRKK